MTPVSLQNIVDGLVSDTLRTSLPLFRPELIMSGTIVALLFTRIFPLLNRIPPFLIAVGGTLYALVASIPAAGFADWASIERQELFTGMLAYDGLTAFMRFFLVAVVLLTAILSRLTQVAGREDGQDFYCLLLGSAIGMCLMASANHMLTLFLGIEMASVPSYVMAGIIKGRSRSSEAALKYAIYGAGTAGVMLYGISLLAGVLGSVHLPTMAVRLAELDVAGRFASGSQTNVIMVLAVGGLMLGVGLAFKLSAFPFHFWCPDVFEGAPAEVNGFLSIASKAAALALLIRVGIGFGHLPADYAAYGESARFAEAQRGDGLGRVAALSEREGVNRSFRLAGAERSAAAGDGNADELAAAERTAEVGVASANEKLAPIRGFFVIVLSIIAVVTCTFGNLAAYGQTNIKRMFAYSTIAHAGYMMMPVAAAVALIGRDAQASAEAIGALLLYAIFYLFMNLGAFSIVAFLRNSLQSEQIKDYAGLVRSCPMISVAMTGILFSLVGLPPLAGFVGKFRVFQSLVEAGGPLMMFLLVAAGLNTAVSLVYYLRVAKTICIDEPGDAAPPVEFGFLPSAYVAAVSLPVLVLGLLPNQAAELARQATAKLFG